MKKPIVPYGNYGNFYMVSRESSKVEATVSSANKYGYNENLDAVKKTAFSPLFKNPFSRMKTYLTKSTVFDSLERQSHLIFGYRDR